MFSLIVALSLFVGQGSSYTYPSEHAVFREAPAFIVSIQPLYETPKTLSKSPKKQQDLRAEQRTRAFRIDPRSIAPITVPVDPEVRAKPTPDKKVELKEEKKVFETVYFEFNSFQLRPSEKTKLDALPKDIEYSVTGFTCNIGGKEYNDRLAFKRAMAVKQYLGELVKEVNARGKCCYVDQKDISKNRRAEIKPFITQKYKEVEFK